MSYDVTQHDCRFEFVNEQAEERAFEAVQALHILGTIYSIQDALDDLGWDGHNMYDGNMHRNSSRYHSDTFKVFQTIAPFVKAGSYTVLVGEDLTIWRFYFDGEKCHEQPGEITFEVPE